MYPGTASHHLQKQKDIPLAAISEMLGHKSIKTTQIYLDSLSDQRKDQLHSQIIEI